MIIYYIWKSHNGIETRLREEFSNKWKVYQKTAELNNKAKKNNSNTKYYIKSIKVF